MPGLPRRARLAVLCLPAVLIPISACADEPTATRPTDSRSLPEMATAGLGSWAPRASLPSARAEMGSGVIRNSSGQDILYVAGGSKHTGVPECILFVNAYNAAKNTWTRKADLPSKRCGPTAAAMGGKLYVVGGLNTNFTVTKTLYVYTPASNTWSRKADMPSAPQEASGEGMVISGNLYVLALFDAVGLPALRLYRYTPATNTWTRLADPPPSQLSLAAAGVINGKIYMIRKKQVPTVEVYDPKTNQWTAKPPIPESDWKPHEPESKDLQSATAVVLNQQLYLIGGISTSADASLFKTTFAYDPVTNRLTRKADMRFERFGHAVGKVKNAAGVIQVIATGGTHQHVEPVYTRETEAYTPPLMLSH